MIQCPYSRNSDPTDPDKGLNGSNKAQAISGLFRQLKDGIELCIDSPEKEQAIYAYRIFQYATQLAKLRVYLNARISIMEEDPGTYKDLTEEVGKFLEDFGRKYFGSIESDPVRIEKLVGGLKTFHAFIKRAVLHADNSTAGEKIFPYIQAQQLASTAMERANIIASDPDYDGWEGLFFDPEYDVSQLLLGIPISRPVYKCPVLYSGKFREIINMYFEVMCDVHEISTDKPKQVDWNQEKLY